MSTVYTLNTTADPFSSLSGTPLVASDLSDRQCNRTRVRRWTSRKSWRYNFCCNAVQSRELTRFKVLTTRWQVFLASVNFSAQQTGDTCTVNCRFNHIIVLLHLCKEYLTVVKLETLFLLQIKYWTFWYMDYSVLIKSNTLKNAWIGRNMWTVKNGWVVILVKYGFIRLLQRIFNCDKTHDIIITSDEVLNSLVYGSPFCVIIYTSYKLSNMVRFFTP